jgi:hypothetical protein
MKLFGVYEGDKPITPVSRLVKADRIEGEFPFQGLYRGGECVAAFHLADGTTLREVTEQ